MIAKSVSDVVDRHCVIEWEERSDLSVCDFHDDWVGRIRGGEKIFRSEVFDETFDGRKVRPIWLIRRLVCADERGQERR